MKRARWHPWTEIMMQLWRRYILRGSKLLQSGFSEATQLYSRRKIFALGYARQNDYRSTDCSDLWLQTINSELLRANGWTSLHFALCSSLGTTSFQHEKATENRDQYWNNMFVPLCSDWHVRLEVKICSFIPQLTCLRKQLRHPVYWQLPQAIREHSLTTLKKNGWLPAGELHAIHCYVVVPQNTRTTVEQPIISDRQPCLAVS